MKNPLAGSSVNSTQLRKKISKLEDRLIETSQTETEREERVKQNKKPEDPKLTYV